MSVLKWLIAGIIGAGIGGAIWVLVGYFGNLEVGYIAWGIGLLAGLGVRRSMQPHEVNTAAGLAAVAAAFAVIAVSKYYVAHLHVENMLGNFVAHEPEPQLLLAHEIVAEREAAGQPVTWPAGKSQDDASSEADFPADVWQAAGERWTKKSAEEQAEFRQARLAEEQQMVDA